MSMLLAVSLHSAVFIFPAQGSADLIISSHSGHVDSSGYYHVIGEVQNTGDQALIFIQIEATFYNIGNAVVDTRLGSTMLQVLLPGRRAPFDIALLDAAESAEVHHYSLTTSFSGGSSLPIGLQISEVSPLVDGANLHVVGEIINAGNERATHVALVATFYDRKGGVVAAVQQFLFQIYSDLDPDQTESFEILFDDETRVPYVDSFELTAESTEYTCNVTGGQVFPTDLNGDRTVNIMDVFIVAQAFKCRPGDSKWNPVADLDKNGEVNIADIFRIARDFGRTFSR
jgi:hypothetical protein